MNATRNMTPQGVLERLHRAQNQHDLEEFVACFAPAYESEQPIHPDRAFHGREQVRKNWASVFSDIPDFQSELLRSAVEGDIVWAEWRWYGTLVEGGQFDWRGITLFGIQDNQIKWARLYMEPVQVSGLGIDAAVTSMTHSSSPEHS